ncbi:MAG: hypothetical protein EZS28_014346 [Streblomastix strix]|uniref:Uncharacterized protein n=1 Tax=Streblomastix strix TaxID=222440 RepID=A0A5J4W639_9EUKA|nr:MAG: hypothetical protein EZS28_014346 [Streblomastix strix]
MVEDFQSENPPLAILPQIKLKLMCVLLEWIYEEIYPCASSALSAPSHKLTAWIPAILDIMPQSQRSEQIL